MGEEKKNAKNSTRKKKTRKERANGQRQNSQRVFVIKGRTKRQAKTKLAVYREVRKDDLG